MSETLNDQAVHPSAADARAAGTAGTDNPAVDNPGAAAPGADRPDRVGRTAADLDAEVAAGADAAASGPATATGPATAAGAEGSAGSHGGANPEAGHADPTSADPASADSTSADAANADPGKVDDIFEALKDVVDPELGINIVDLGLVYDVVLGADNTAVLDMTLTSAACPLTDMIEDQVRGALVGLHPGEGLVEDFRINWVWMPPWDLTRITDDGRDQLRALGFAI